MQTFLTASHVHHMFFSILLSQLLQSGYFFRPIFQFTIFFTTASNRLIKSNIKYLILLILFIIFKIFILAFSFNLNGNLNYFYNLYTSLVKNVNLHLSYIYYHILSQ